MRAQVPAVTDGEDLLESIEPPTARLLLQCALEKFSQAGYHATTTRDICSAASMSPAALYIYYPSKEDMLFALSRIAHFAALEAATSSLASVEDPVDRVHALIRSYTSWHLGHVDLARIAQYELRSLSPTHYAEIVALRRKTERLFELEIKAGVVSGAFEVEDVRGATFAVLALGIDVIRWYRGSGSVKTIAKRTAAMAMRMLRAPQRV
jgi:AcrR family transcriptional regulator